MAITSAIRSTPTHKNTAVGAFLDDGTVKKSAFALGFRPRYVRLENATDRISYEWFEGMAADSAIKTVAAGTRTLDTSNGISVGTLNTGAASSWTVYGQTLGGATDSSHLNAANEVVEGFNVPAAIVTTGKQFYFVAYD